MTAVSIFLAFACCGQTFNGQGGLLVPPGAPAQTVGITTSIATVSGIGILGTGCSYIENVTIDLNHTFDGDIAIFLIAPSGEVLEFSSGNGGSGDNFQITVFKDNTPNFITSGFPPYNGTFRPEGRQTNTTPPFLNTNPLGTYTFQNTFSGVDADGDWTLMINDYVAIDVGVLNAWSITFATGGGPAPSVNLGPDVTICPGQSATLTATVTPAANSYLWSNGATTQSINVTPATNTTYSVTVTNNGCIDADTIQVIVNPNAVTANAGTDVSICQGTSTTLTGSGGGAGATYNWSSGQSGASISVMPTSTTTYTLTVSNGGCSATDQVVVTVTPQPVAEAGPPVSICQGQSTTLTASGGTQNNQYQWSTGQNGPSISVSPVTTTTYTVTVTINGCSDTDDVVVTVNNPPTVDAGPDVQICAGESVDLTASGSGGTYQWSNGQSGATITVSPSSTTTYTVTATQNGCTATDNITVTVGNITAGVTPNQSICEGASVTLTATGGTSYEWSTGDTGPSITVSPASTTTYTVTATQGSCTDDASVTITVNPVPIATVSPDEEICAGEPVTLTASGGTTYAWSSGQNTSSITVSPPVTTTYIVTVTSNGCSSTESVQVVVNPTPNANAGPDENICQDETIVLTAGGGNPGDSYQWSSGQTTSSISVTPTVTTTYTVTITNQFNCFDADNVTVVVNPIPNANAGPDQEICEGNSATLTASGGTNPSTYLWSTGQTGASITVSPLSDQTYTVTITVAGCSAEDEVEVMVLQSPTASAGNDQEVCGGTQVELTATGGGTYQWSNGQSTQIIQVTPSVTTNYSVTVTAANGCTDVDNVTVTVNPPPQANAGQDQTICEGETTSLSGSGGNVYLWSTGETTANISVSPASTTSYGLTVTDINGCSDTDVATVIVNPIPFANAGPNTFIINGESATLTASGGGTYLWSTGEITAQITVTPTNTTTYSVTVTLNGCTDVDEVTVFVNEAPSVDLGPDVIICEGEMVTLDASIAGPFDLEFIWNTGATSSSITVTPNTTTLYSVTATDNTTGLFSIDTIQVTVLTLPLGIPVINGMASLCENETGTYTIDPVPGATSYNWIIPGGATLVSGQGTTSITVNWNSSPGGPVQVIASNSCGSLPAAILNIVISAPPLLAGPIVGDAAPCADGSSGYSIPVVANADTYQWTVSGGGLITTGQGTASISINWNGSAGGDVCVTASNECGNSMPVCFTVTTTSTPQLSAGTDTAVCGLTASLEGSGTGLWTLVSGPGAAVFSNEASPNSLIEVSVPGVYIFKYSISQNGCFAEDEVVIDFNDAPSIINVLTDCNDLNTAYAVIFEITGGSGPFTVNGSAINGNTFSSGSINSGDPYSFQVTDANGCQSQTITDEILCLCNSAAGTMQTGLIEACIGSTVTGIHNGGEMLDGNDVLGFILHNGVIPGGILAWSLTPEFSFQAGMLPEITYFISAVTGDEGTDGFPSLNDACLDISEGTPVVFHALPSATIDGDTTLCRGNCSSIMIETSGNGTVEIGYSVGSDIFSVNGNTGSIDIPVCPDVNTTYIFSTISDDYCTGVLDTQIVIEVNEALSAGIPSHVAICEGHETLIDLSLLLIDEDAGGVWAEVSAIPSTPGAFDPVNGTFNAAGQQIGTYSFQYEIAAMNGCPGSQAIANLNIMSKPVADAGDDMILRCDETSVTLSGNGSSSGADIRYSWTTSNGVISGPVDQLQANATSEGDYILVVSNVSSGCSNSDTVHVSAPALSISDLVISVTAPLCNGDCNGIIEIQSTDTGLLYDFGNGNFVAENIYATACSGSHMLAIMDTLGCVLDTNVFLVDPPSVSVDLGPDQTIQAGESIVLFANTGSAVASYNWNDASTCTTCASITVTPSETIMYAVEVTDSNGCKATDEILVSLLVTDVIYVPTVFSPNGDGINDEFIVFGGPTIRSIRSMAVFDRWGGKVFEQTGSAGTSLSWDGSFANSPLNPGVYVYKVEAEFSSGEIVYLTGDVTLIR